jgi:hypothetical protein
MSGGHNVLGAILHWCREGQFQGASAFDEDTRCAVFDFSNSNGPPGYTSPAPESFHGQLFYRRALDADEAFSYRRAHGELLTLAHPATAESAPEPDTILGIARATPWPGRELTPGGPTVDWVRIAIPFQANYQPEGGDLRGSILSWGEVHIARYDSYPRPYPHHLLSSETRTIIEGPKMTDVWDTNGTEGEITLGDHWWITYRLSTVTLNMTPPIGARVGDPGG